MRAERGKRTLINVGLSDIEEFRYQSSHYKKESITNPEIEDIGAHCNENFMKNSSALKSDRPYYAQCRTKSIF